MRGDCENASLIIRQQRRRIEILEAEVHRLVNEIHLLKDRMFCEVCDRDLTVAVDCGDGEMGHHFIVCGPCYNKVAGRLFNEVNSGVDKKMKE